jgi:WD40 repeat protein
VLVVSWSPDGAMIASGDMDGAIMLWDGRDGKLLGTCQGHKKWITSLVSPLVGWLSDGRDRPAFHHTTTPLPPNNQSPSPHHTHTQY